MFKKKYLILLLIFLLAFILRFWRLEKIPLGFHNDEIMNGYVGRFILNNGVDLYGNPWPVLYFDNFGDYPNVLPMYLSGLFTYIFGINQFAVRFPIALMGFLTVVLTYLLAKWIFKDQLVIYLTVLVSATLPWHIILSRATAEGITASFFFLLAFFLIFQFVETNKYLKIIIGFPLLLITYLLYPSFRIIAPLSILLLTLINKKARIKKVCWLTTVFLISLTLVISKTNWARGRYLQTSVFHHNNVIAGRAINYSLALESGHILEARIFSNKYVLAIREIIRQYFKYFSLDFFTGTEIKPPRYQLIENSLAYFSLVFIVFLAVLKQFVLPMSKQQLEALFNQKRSIYLLILLVLFFISPISAILTLDDVPNIHRASLMPVLLPFFIGFCMAVILKKISPVLKNTTSVVFATLIFIETIFFWHYYTNVNKEIAIAHRNEEQHLAGQWLVNNYDKIIYTSNNDNLPIHYLFAKKNFSKNLIEQFRSGLRIDQVDNVVFVDEKCPADSEVIKTLTKNDYILSRASCDLIQGLEVVEVINYPNGLEAYKVLRLNL